MFRRTTVVPFLVLFSCFGPTFGQEKPPAAAAAAQQFPVTLLQNVVAGKTPVGTKVEARLTVATLVAGTVIPRNAVFSGAVIQSAAKAGNEPSRLALHMDSVQWKNGSANVNLYLTQWFYPATAAAGQELQYGPTQPANRTWNGQGQYPDPNSKVYRPFPSDGSNQDSPVPDTPSSSTSNHPVQMKNVESARTNDGAIVISSHHSNIKLDKLTTYVLTPTDLTSAK